MRICGKDIQQENSSDQRYVLEWAFWPKQLDRIQGEPLQAFSNLQEKTQDGLN